MRKTSKTRPIWQAVAEKGSAKTRKESKPPLARTKRTSKLRWRQLSDVGRLRLLYLPLAPLTGTTPTATTPFSAKKERKPKRKAARRVSKTTVVRSKARKDARARQQMKTMTTMVKRRKTRKLMLKKKRKRRQDRDRALPCPTQSI